MSADNFIGVYKHGFEWVVCHGFMSPLMDAESGEFVHEYPDGYWGHELSRHPSREAAAVAALDQERREMVVEYGVIELAERDVRDARQLESRCYTSRSDELRPCARLSRDPRPDLDERVA